MLMYSLGDTAKNVKESIYHIEGDPDHPVTVDHCVQKAQAYWIIFIVKPVFSILNIVHRVRINGSVLAGMMRLIIVARLMKDDRDANFIEKNAHGVIVNRWSTTGMLCSSAASNETGILDGKFARGLDMVAIDCQARLCHGPTVAALAPTFGRGAMTNDGSILKNASVVLIMGGNAAEAHPVGAKWVVEAQTKNDATVVVVDPRLNRSAAVADLYAPIRAGSDTVFCSVIRYLLENDRVQYDYVRHYTNARLIIRDDYQFNDGLFSGYDYKKSQYDKSSWFYQLDEQGNALRDDTLSHPRCVWNLLKAHVERYTPEMVNRLCGTSA